MKNSTKIFVLIAIVIIVISSARLVKTITAPVETIPEAVITETQPEASAPVVPPKFSWKFVYDEKGDGLPRTAITLDTTYESGKTVTTAIRTIEGSCNEIDKKPGVDADMVIGSAKVQCYAAGFGDRFKIVEGENSYEVLHQEFAEATPEYQVPDQSYKTIVTVPFNY